MYSTIDAYSSILRPNMIRVPGASIEARGKVDGINGFIVTCGWGSWGFKAAPVAGKRIAELIATGETPELIKPFALSRFGEGNLVNERAAAPAAAIH